MFPSPNQADSTGLGLLVFVFAPAVFLLGWLYNTHRLGKFKKPQRTAPDIMPKSAGRKRRPLLFWTILGTRPGLCTRLCSLH